LSKIAALSSIVWACSFIPSKENGRKGLYLSDTIFESRSLFFKKVIAILVHMIMIFCLLFRSQFFMTAILNCDDIRVMPDGNYCYYVNVTCDGDTFTLPGNVSKESGKYAINYIYLNNEDYLEITSSDFLDYDETHIETVDYEEANREYEFSLELTLTNKSANHKLAPVNETKLIWNDIEKFLCIIVQIIVIKKHLNDYKDQNSEVI
jgi:hypothetical protein